MRPRYALEGKTVLITGAASGIGAGLARAFAAQGVRLVLLDRTADVAFQGSLCDLNDDTQVAAFAQDFQTRYGTLDVLVNNAGAEYPTPLNSTAANAMARWSALLDNNVASMVRLTRALLPCMGAGACIINQSSIWGRSEAELEQELLAQQALPTMLTPDDIAGVYLFLASSDAAPLTGQSLVASNGEVMA